VDNLFNLNIAQRLYEYRTYYQLSVDEDTVLSGNWDLTSSNYDYEQDPRYKMKLQFQAPIAVRLGVKFIF